jgi:pyruvate kinase
VPDVEIVSLRADMIALRQAVLLAAEPAIAGFGGASDPALVNLAHYLALRHHDVRDLQRRVMACGLSSLGRLESRVLPTFDAVIHALDLMAGSPSDIAVPQTSAFFAGEQRLAAASDALFLSAPRHRRTRIMVTLPSEAADDGDFVLMLAERGMDIARINCAHDDAAAWKRMVAHVHAAGDSIGRRIGVMMDIAGPKIRIEAVDRHKKAERIEKGGLLRLTADGAPRADGNVPFAASVSLPEIVLRIEIGHRLRYDDGKLEGVVESKSDGAAIIRITKSKSGGVKLKPERGINLPDTALGLSPLTAKDESDLKTVISHADMLGYSFVSRAGDLDLLEEALTRHPPRATRLGLVAKIERPEAVNNLPALIARAAGRRPLGVMIARGDLAAELGFERLAEMQEEILWICEAASVPVIWATQVLEGLVKQGLPSRGEMTDAAMASRAECVMLNKGPGIGEGITVLDGLLARMDDHIFKKTPTLRALKSW